MGKASRRKLHARMKASEAVTEKRLKALGIDVPVLTRHDLPQEQKISNAIAEILRTEIGKDASFEDHCAYVNSIVIAWNMTLLSPEWQEKQFKALEAFFSLHGQGDAADDLAGAQSLLRRLMQKKETLFPDDKRVIVSHDCQLIGGKVHVTASALTTQGQPVPVA